VFHYSPYGTDAAPFEIARRFLEAGYVYLGANMRGTGCSEGVDMEGGGSRAATVGRDGAEVVEWAAAQRWSDGNVGMIGTSYAGELQLAVAANHPPHLKAIVPSGISASDYRESYMPGGMFHMGGMGWWTVALQPKLADSAERTRIAAGDTECAAIRAKQPPQRAYWDVKEHPLQDAWWKERSGEAVAGAITVPTLVLMGWQDEWNLNAGTRLFELLRALHKKIILQNGGHGVGASGPPGYAMDQAEMMRWLDRWLKGLKNGVENEPAVTVLWEVKDTLPTDGSRATVGWTTTYAGWPVPGIQHQTLYLTPDGLLSRQPPALRPDQGERGYLYPAGTELVGSNEQFSLAPFDMGTLNYRSEPMATDVAMLGMPKLTFFFSSEQADTDFMITLKDVDPAGDTLFLQRAFLRASLRAVDWSQSTPDEIIQSFDRIEPLTPGKIYKIELSIPAIGHVLRRGHRLELSILAPSPIPAPVMGGVPVGLPSLNRVYQSPEYPSVLTLPVAPGEVALAAPPECGSLQFQPCRHAHLIR
jgi:putative CocE/NonD family hydrolase